jgi:ABC-type multidrug transport system permease subunit
VILPQVFFGDLIWSIDALPPALRWIAYLMPLTHANIATRNVLLKGQSLWESWPYLLVLVGMGLLAMLLLSVVGRRRAGGG